MPPLGGKALVGPDLDFDSNLPPPFTPLCLPLVPPLNSALWQDSVWLASIAFILMPPILPLVEGGGLFPPVRPLANAPRNSVLICKNSSVYERGI